MNFSGNIPISGWSYSTFSNDSVSLFDRLLEIFKELLTYTSGDFDEAVDWLRQLDKEYSLTTEDYTIDDFIDELLNKGFISTEINTTGGKELMKITSKMESCRTLTRSPTELTIPPSEKVPVRSTCKLHGVAA